jgi:O-acetyl-ADP-ribose deacetylase (regulator of RNase III)
MLKLTKGNLLTLAEQGKFDAIVQGCNCFCTMGSGIARQIKEQYPGAYEADSKTMSGDIGKLGNWTDFDTGKFTIINAYTQFDFNRKGQSNDVFEYTSFELILRKLGHLYGTKNFGFPMIGMGLAGGDVQRIMGLLEWFDDIVSAQGGSVTVVEFG